MNANVGYCLKCGATQGNHYSPECLPGFATTDPVKYYAVVMQQDYDALAAQMAEMRQAMDELHVKHGRSMRGIEQLEARLAEAERDAARYRWLRNTATTSDWCDLGGLTAERTDEEIDKALGAVSAPDRETGVTP